VFERRPRLQVFQRALRQRNCAFRQVIDKLVKSRAVKHGSIVRRYVVAASPLCHASSALGIVRLRDRDYPELGAVASLEPVSK
jgi:hypothetical protein